MSVFPSRASTCHSSFLLWHVLTPLQITFSVPSNVGKAGVQPYSIFGWHLLTQEKPMQFLKLIIVFKHTKTE